MPAAARAAEVSGVWDAVSQTTIDDGVGAGDTRIEKQEWHLTQAGDVIKGYYIAALTFVSGDGRPYVCSRQPQFSAMQRFDVAGRIRGKTIEIEERGIETSAAGSRCHPGARELARYRGRLEGDVITLVGAGQRRTLYRIQNHGGEEDGEETLVARAAGPRAPLPADRQGPDLGPPPPATDPSKPEAPGPSALSSSPDGAGASASTDLSGLWVWEHHGTIPGGDQKQEREEWHVVQEGSKLSGYYDRIVHQVSSDGNAYRCSMALDFQIATRYKFRGEVSGNRVRIFESSYEVLTPSACDNGKRRLDAYEGHASSDEIRLVWGVGGQILRRPRPDVPTQRF